MYIVCPSVWPSIYLSIPPLCIHPFIYPTVHAKIYFYLENMYLQYFHLTIYSSSCLSTYSPIHPFVHLSIYSPNNTAICPPIHIFIHTSICLFIHLFIQQYSHLSTHTYSIYFCPFIHNPSVYLSIHPFIVLSLHPPVCSNAVVEEFEQLSNTEESHLVVLPLWFLCFSTPQTLEEHTHTHTPKWLMKLFPKFSRICEEADISHLTGVLI